MTSLEKEKSPLEGQCAFLENQKNKLTEEFNKIILQINKNNQELENKQSQLRASLIQNYEIHDQKNYVETKLTQLKNDLEQFLMNYQDSDEEKTLKENIHQKNQNINNEINNDNLKVLHQFVWRKIYHINA